MLVNIGYIGNNRLQIYNLLLLNGKRFTCVKMTDTPVALGRVQTVSGVLSSFLNKRGIKFLRSSGH